MKYLRPLAALLLSLLLIPLAQAATVSHTNPSMAGVSTLAKSFLWETLTSANAVGDAANVSQSSVSLTVQVLGTFNGATVVMQGSNDGTNWSALHDATGAAVAVTAAGILSLSDLPLYVRPSTSGGGGSQDLDIILVIR